MRWQPRHPNTGDDPRPHPMGHRRDSAEHPRRHRPPQALDHGDHTRRLDADALAKRRVTETDTGPPAVAFPERTDSRWRIHGSADGTTVSISTPVTHVSSLAGSSSEKEVEHDGEHNGREYRESDHQQAAETTTQRAYLH
jgi:hypothetical protein